MSIFQRPVWAAALFCGSLFLTHPASAAVIQTQPPCSVASGPCLSFGPTQATAPPLVRTIDFIAPGPGKAAVSFTGSMVCSAFGGAAPSRGYDFVSGITDRASDVPNITKAGTIRITGRLGAPGPDGLGLSATTNMAATRVFTIPAAGTKRFFLKLATLRLETVVGCSIYDAAFTVIFVP